MPVPAILAGLAAAGAAALGVGAQMSAKEKNELAQKIADESKKLYDNSKLSLEKAQGTAETSLLNLGNLKKQVLETSVKQFLTVYERIKNIELSESVGFDEIKNFTFEKQDVLQLREMSNIYQTALSSGTAGAATGAIIALAASGYLPFVTNTLSIAGAALSAGEIGMAASLAGSALFWGAAMTPLTAIAAPAVLFSGISTNLKADENLEKAQAMCAEAESTSEKMKTAEILCNAIADRADMLDDLLLELNKLFSCCTDNLDKVTTEKLNAIGNESVDATTFNEDELKMIAVARALAGAVKAVIDTPILTTEGSISSESLNVCNNVGKLLPDFSKIIKSENSGITSEGIEITAGKIKIPTQSAEESVNRVMGWIAAHHGFDKIAVYEVADYFIMRLLNRGDSVYTAGEGSVSPETIRIDKSTGAVAVDAYVDNSVINDVSEMSWKMPERLFCRGNELYAFDAGIKMFDAATLTGFDLIASKERLGCDSGNCDVASRAVNAYKTAAARGYNFSGCENYLAFVSEGILYRYDIENQNCQKLCRTSADSIFATDRGVYLLTRGVPSSWLEFYDYAECKIVRGFSVDSADKIYHVCGDCDFYLGDGPVVKRVHKGNDGGTTATLFSDEASSIVYAYDDCIMYAANGFLNKLSYTTGKKVTLISGVVCRKAVDVGVIRHKIKYETIPAGFVRIGKWVYYYEDGSRDLPYRVAIDTPDKVKAVPNYRVLEDAERI